MADSMHSDSNLLEELNSEEAKQYVGGVVFVAIVMTIGIIGNLHVLLVYAFRIKPSNHRTFILILGALDLTTCSVGMPFIIVDLRNPLTFTMTSACKLLRFINYFICTSSALVLLVIAVDRYRKICVPLGRQVSRHMAIALCSVVIFIAALISWPAPVLFGDSTVQTSYPDVNGTRCYTEDRFQNTKYMLFFNAVLILIVISVFIILVALYSLIGRTISLHTHFRKPSADESLSSNGVQINSTTETSDIKEIYTTGSSGEMLMSETGTSTTITRDGSKFSNDVTKVKKWRKPNHKNADDKSKQTNRSRKTTLIFFLITAVFFMSYMPHLVLKIVTFTKKSFVPGMSFTGKVLYNTFIWCFFINNMANSIIYGFCDNRFRQEVKKAYVRVLNFILRRN